ncbi:hypothetical protein HYALB_00012439 [Hymenoscyphus albidus]|uniref:Uncharacterized protein n=1 Tax=Hymenoscyphus albidus TaxID=595503 RepID=A0A9N9LVR8_9HELO|nr:hypothetical protein HYALB_00012439 [Hymenoscyphus albidus]
MTALEVGHLAAAETPESWATATQPAINLWAGSLHIAWRRAIASTKAPPEAANFKWLPGTTAHILTKLPAVRTPFSVWSGRTLFLPRRYSSINSSDREPVVEWVPLPTNPVYTSIGDTTNVYASALLVTQVPQSKNGIPVSTMTCSIDARWGPGEALMGNGPLVPVLDSAHLRAPSEQTNSYNEAAGFLPKDDGSWQSILLKPEWLKTLTPFLESNGKNQSTLAILFEAIGLINGTISIPDTDIVYSVAANAVATLVTDGISRIGTHSQAGNPTISACYIDPQDFPSFFSGDQQEPSYTYPPPFGVSAANQTQMTWYITIPGLAYKADNIAIQLALALLFFYIAMALSHVGWIIWTGYFFGAWKNPAELMILAKNSSPAPGSLANTCAAIETSGMWKRTARIRVAESQKLDDQEEELHLLIDAVGEADYTHEKAKYGVAYGQRRAENSLAL